MRRIEGVVVHRAECDFGSYHRVIQRDGTVTLEHHDAEIAQHAIAFNPQTLAVALVGDFAPGEHALHSRPTDAQMTALKALVRAWDEAYGPLWLAGHSELGSAATRFPEKLVSGHTCPGENLDLSALRSETGLPPYAPSDS